MPTVRNAVLLPPMSSPLKVGDYLMRVGRSFGFHPGRKPPLDRIAVAVELGERIIAFTSTLPKSKEHGGNRYQLSLPLPYKEKLRPKKRAPCLSCPMWRRENRGMEPRPRNETLSRDAVDELVIAWACALTKMGFRGNMRFLDNLRSLKQIAEWLLGEYGYRLPKGILPNPGTDIIAHRRWVALARDDGASEREILYVCGYLFRTGKFSKSA